MTDTAPTAVPPSRKKLVVGSLAAVAVAAVALVVFVLPAEYGIDPTGAGKALGLTKLSEPAMNEEQIRGAKRVGVLALAEQPPQRTDWTDSWEITLRPYESIELKYTLDKGAALDFTWTATGPLYYDMHSHPFDGGDKLTETYSLGTLDQMHGRYVSQFSGLHGWYWQNRTMSDVTLSLKAAGPITESTLFEMGIPRKRELTPPK
ncbi:hypothetical protein KK137_08855 [Croceibacterium sp. LX-88]|jgi:hypothetical protein|uniref:Transmembrane anchor protein n=1 Tax=Croceibacterium selenioxidans TaxID=2838833 RepID=A0ABS5W7T0_9SPHN|nr:hypothetical protein [Croceibacterium selenioxidans]MBT2134439.1 hypothetical protein [Croceibacterium selenioxidans]